MGCVERGQGWNELRWCVQGWLGHERRKGSIMTGDEIMMGRNVKREEQAPSLLGMKTSSIATKLNPLSSAVLL